MLLVKVGNSYWNVEFIKRAIDSAPMTKKQTASGVQSIPEPTLAIYQEGEATPHALRGADRAEFLAGMQKIYDSQAYFTQAMGGDPSPDDQQVEWTVTARAERHDDTVERAGEDFDEEEDDRSSKPEETDGRTTES